MPSLSRGPIDGLQMGVAVAPALGLPRQHRPAGALAGRHRDGVFVASFGTAGFATRRDLTALARLCRWALLGLLA